MNAERREKCWNARDAYFQCLDQALALEAGRKGTSPKALSIAELSSFENTLSSSGSFIFTNNNTNKKQKTKNNNRILY